MILQEFTFSKKINIIEYVLMGVNMFAVKDYYALARKINEIDKNTEDNDLKLFSDTNYESNRRRCIPTDETYHDYYYHYLGMTKRLTLHDEILNNVEFNGEKKKRFLRKKRITYGIHVNGKTNDQPIFNNQFLNEISRNGYLTIYSSKK